MKISKIGKIRGFTSSFANEFKLATDIILKINEIVRKVNMLIGDNDDKKR